MARPSPQGVTIDLSTPITIQGPAFTVAATRITRDSAPTSIFNSFTVTNGQPRNISSNPLSPVTITVSASAPTSGSNPTSSSVNIAGMMAGISVGAVLGFAVILSFIFWWRRRRKRKSRRIAVTELSATQQEPSSAEKGIHDNQGPHELAGRHLHEVSGEQHHEMPAASAAWEVPADNPSTSTTRTR